ncbi:hybrid sensor histidine kinase/response regulator [Dongia deserti]|uniref:hybrid sensor histidine kinase/response regulator n=1 Tax=Dongia deserti TaxID=2268030 RepID=UPI000E653FAE|nr:hybrid sensor histidine kinase/response regulator [Dongia deserti]
MTGRQRIARVRRQYNQWVGNETLEDYALRFTARSARRWSYFRVSNTALGAISFLACEAIGGALTLEYGFTNAAASILAVGALIFLTGLPIGYYATKHGVDVDLLTRGAGFGYIGSTITSLIYASFTFLLFSVEAVIMALALEMWFGMPLWAAYVVCALVIIPMVTYGIRFISRMQLWTQPIWLILQIAPLAYIAFNDSASLSDWASFTGKQGDGAGTFNLLLFGAAGSTLLSFVPQIGEQVDYLRFLPDPARQGGGLKQRIAWWTAMLTTGPGWIFIGAIKLLAGSFLAVLALSHGVPHERAAEPTQIFRVAFESMSLSPQMAIVLTGILVITCQIKINATNIYAGSIAWSNFFSRLTHSHPGRVVWVVFNTLLALLLMELGIFAAIERILTLYSNLAVAWIGALVADLVINKPLGLSPRGIEFRRAHLYDINPVGVGAMLVSIVCSTAAYFGMFGPAAQALSPFIGLFVAIAVAPVIAFWTRGRYYIAREPHMDWQGQIEVRCCICEHVFEREDMSFCPAYAGPICSLCCTLDARCHDLCKTNSRFTEQLQVALRRLLPSQLALGLNSRLGRFAGLFLTFNLVIGIALLLIGVFQGAAGSDVDAATVRTTLLSTYFALFGISGIAAWLLVLAHESRQVAEEESARQNQMLTHEIEAHERTYEQLQKAKLAAESANLAKSRYIVGLSHEIRAPLNAIFGYAQILERDTGLPPRRQEAVRVIRRSSEHLSTLVDGLLDIAKIEAGRLHLNRDRIALVEVVEQIVGMFEIQARNKGISFLYEPAANIPPFVYADEKRLRQILINLLSNAVKYTHEGHVAFRVRYRGQVCEFEVADTGIGIQEEDLSRIFEPFERGSSAGALSIPGTGLGLTITKLLTEIMGGEIAVESKADQGSVFRVRLMLFAAEAAPAILQQRRIKAYDGRRISVIAADDDSAHLELLRDLLVPIGFELHTALNGGACLELAAAVAPDLALLDLSMPGKSGWEVVQALRAMNGARTGIIIVSANLDEQRKMTEFGVTAFVSKPIDVQVLLSSIQRILGLAWIYDEPEPAPNSSETAPPIRIHSRDLEDLHRLGKIGYVRGIEAKLAEMEASDPDHGAFVADMRALVRDFELKRYMAVLDGLREQ